MEGIETREEHEARGILLKYYSSECIQHGAYIVSVFIGLFAFMQIRSIFAHADSHTSQAVFSMVLSIFPTVIFYFAMKTLIWGYLAGQVIFVKPWDYDKAERRLYRGIREGEFRVTLLNRLHYSCCELLETRHGFWYSFASTNYSIFVLICLYVISFAISYVLVFPVVFTEAQA